MRDPSTSYTCQLAACLQTHVRLLFWELALPALLYWAAAAGLRLPLEVPLEVLLPCPAPTLCVKQL